MTSAKENLEMFKDFSNSGYESVRALGEINLRTWEKLVEKQMDTFGLMMDAGIAQFQLATETKDPKTLVEAQVELTRKLGEDLVSKGKETVEIANDVRDEYRTWFESGVKTFNTKVNATAKKAA